MGLWFFAPFFLGGLLIAAIPYIIHRIRRPEREPLRFSSLMFIPKVTKEIIERRRLQHILLMLLRMFLLAALAFAFSRPYWRVPATKGQGTGPEKHIVLIDNSYSMVALGHFDAAKSRAEQLLARMKPEERAGVIAFARSPRMIAPLSVENDPEAGSPDFARKAVGNLALTEDTTAYLPAMQMAQEQLLAGIDAAEEEGEQLTIHVISDFQKSGLPQKNAGWRLSPRIAFDAIDVGEDNMKNQSVEDLSVRRNADGNLRIQAKIKNWSHADEQQTEVKLIVAGEIKQTSTISIKPGNASQTSFDFKPEGAGRLEGWIEIGEDAITLDNRRYFVWTPPERNKLVIVRDDQPSKAWPGSAFIKRALPQGEGGLWDVTELTQAELLQMPAEKRNLSELVVLSDLNRIQPETADILLQHARTGGRALALLDQSLGGESLNANLLGKLGVTSLGSRFAAGKRGLTLLSWIDFEHPIFSPFQGSRYNDFTQIRFMNFQKLQVAQTSSPGADGVNPILKTIARFEADDAGNEWPAILEAGLGKGKFIFWAFGAGLEENNLAKSIKFVPLLLETFSYLSDKEKDGRAWAIGEVPRQRWNALGSAGGIRVQYPAEEEAEISADKIVAWEPNPFRHAGFFRARRADENEWQKVEAVNVAPGESDPARISIADFQLKTTSKSPDDGAAVVADARQTPPPGYAVRREYWQILLGILFVSLLVESWYAPRLLR